MADTMSLVDIGVGVGAGDEIGVGVGTKDPPLAPVTTSFSNLSTIFMVVVVVDKEGGDNRLEVDSIPKIELELVTLLESESLSYPVFETF